jgi:hypothetical protein
MHRRAAALVLVATLGLVSTACGGASSGSGGSPSSPPVEVDVDTAVTDQDRLNGASVQVRGFLLVEPGRARMCSAVMESYPPQCGGATILLRGGIPQALLDRLDSTTDQAGLAPVAWGDVVVTGTLRADDAGGPPVIELGAISVARPE